MSDRQKYLARFTGLCTAFILIALLLFAISERIANPTNYSYSISEFTDMADEKQKTLPYVAAEKQHVSRLKGIINFAHVEVNSPVYVYIPRFDGVLDIYSGGLNVFSGSSPLWISRSGFALFEISIQPDNTSFQLEFSLEESNKPFIRLSKIFVGDGMALSNHLFSALWVSSWGPLVLSSLHFFSFFSFIFMYFHTPSTYREGYGRRAVPLFAVSAYILGMLIFSNDQFEENSRSTLLWTVFSAPILIVNFWVAARYFSGKNKYKRELAIQLIGFCFGVLLLGASVLFDDSLRIPPLALSATILVTGLISLTFVSLNDFSNGRGAYTAFASIGFFSFATCVIHDAAMRLNIFSDHYFLASVGIGLFAFINVVYFFKIVQDASERQDQSAATLRRALKERSNELKFEFEQNAALRANQAAVAEKKRILEDLHDGVLSYLSIITILTEGNSEERNLKVNKASRSASNEIRLLMETEESNEISLIFAIGNLRRQFIDRLAETGICIEYDLYSIVPLQDLEFRIVIETIRIIQEAVHNAVFRGHCLRLKIVAKMMIRNDAQGPAAGFRIHITNNGGETFVPGAVRGAGISNMQMRARRINASFRILPIDGGADVFLSWPSESSDPTD